MVAKTANVFPVGEDGIRDVYTGGTGTEAWVRNGMNTTLARQ